MSFTHATLPHLETRVMRLGIASNYGISADDVRYAAERGVGYWLHAGRRGRAISEGLREALRSEREKHVVSYVHSSFWGGQVRRAVESALRELGTDYLDIYKLGWLGTGSRYSQGIIDALQALVAEGKLRAFGTSIHDRQRAGRLAADSPLDVFMIRYNAKHPGAEQDIFPHLAARDPVVVAYTATAWRQLLRPVRGVEQPPLSAAQCYRFCLTSPHVHVVLSGPRDRAELDQNLAALEQGPLEGDELARVRAYGAEIKAKRKLDYL
ncbi:MAG: aldo/keto reductase [Myxococcales bacterium]|nr:aldo/keto reductase [Myxococcales bacterium]